MLFRSGTGFERVSASYFDYHAVVSKFGSFDLSSTQRSPRKLGSLCISKLIFRALRDGTFRFGQIEEELSSTTPNITQRISPDNSASWKTMGYYLGRYTQKCHQEEYTLTKQYKSLMPIVELMYICDKEHMVDHRSDRNTTKSILAKPEFFNICLCDPTISAGTKG